MPQVIALKPHRYANKARAVGAEYDIAGSGDLRLYQALGWVRPTGTPTPAPAPRVAAPAASTTAAIWSRARLLSSLTSCRSRPRPPTRARRRTNEPACRHRRGPAPRVFVAGPRRVPESGRAGGPVGCGRRCSVSPEQQLERAVQSDDERRR